jgi:helicase
MGLKDGLHGEDLEVEERASEPVLDLALDTIGKGKQALVFVSTKRSAEKAAEDIAKKAKPADPAGLGKLAEQALNVLGRPTRQCERLAYCLRRGIAFHHAGLHARQKELVERAFRDRKVGIIACTPTLAAGLDLPAFRAIIRDLRRYGPHGSQYIPVLEFHQMAGRAGRPKYDTWGEAITIASGNGEKADIAERYIFGRPEPIESKLEVEPVLRTYLLSLIATGIIGTRDEILEFFGQTFWAFQYKDMKLLGRKLGKMLALLEEWEFLEQRQDRYRATAVGRRVAELYIDPLTAHNFITALRAAAKAVPVPLALLHLACCQLEMRPLLHVRQKEYEEVQEQMTRLQSSLLVEEPSMFEPEYEDWLDAFKTGRMLADWMEEVDEEVLLERWSVRPGETRAKLTTADWLLYALAELAALHEFRPLLAAIKRVRFRLKYGVKEELLPLVEKLTGIGRVRGRRLYAAGFRTPADLRRARPGELEVLIGPEVARSVREQVGTGDAGAQ